MMLSTGLPFRFDGMPKISAAAIAEIPSQLSTKAALLDQLYRQLRFPDYFGDNWDALEECIRDLSWLPPGAVVVIHQDLPLDTDIPNLKIYLSILCDAVKKWSRSVERDLVVVFPHEVEEQITWIFSRA
jgi:RNAse (barnase) inhibitor barstar